MFLYLFKHSRNSKKLDGTWQAIPDPYKEFKDLNIYDPEKSEEDGPKDFDLENGFPVQVPGTWSEQLPEFEYYEGWMWYAKRFDCGNEGERFFLHFGATNYKAEVWLNGERLGSHKGGFTPFQFEVTDILEDKENTLVVLVDNTRRKKGVPTLQTDWFNFGGINRSVELISLPETFVRNFRIETDISEDEVGIRSIAWLDGPDTGGGPILEIPGLDVERKLEEKGESRYVSEFSIPRGRVDLWDIDFPKLYGLKISCGDDEVEDRIGFRSIETEGTDIILNGDKVWLRGISLHEEMDGQGRTLDSEDVRKRFKQIKDLNCNFARLAHYPHTPEMARKADEEGILLWEEIPNWQEISFGDERVQDLIKQQLGELIQRDWNRPSVVLWSVANETDPDDPVRNEVLPEMVEYVRGLDPSRLVTAACFVGETDQGNPSVKDPLKEHLDVVGINEYYGWYYGGSRDMEDFVEDPQGKPIVISEMGGGAKWGNHGSEDERWTEEYQEALYRNQIESIRIKDQIQGLSPWILFDFRTPRRMNEYQRGYNRKGILSPDGKKKKSYYVLRNFYDEKIDREA